MFFFLMIRRPPRSTLDRSSAASDVYKRQVNTVPNVTGGYVVGTYNVINPELPAEQRTVVEYLSLIHISEPTRPY